jgi:glutamate carboxypeptidase
MRRGLARAGDGADAGADAGAGAGADIVMAPMSELRTIAAEVAADMEALVAISSPSGDVEGAERALALCTGRLPAGAAIERVPCSSPAHAPDLLARVAGDGHGRVLLLGHVDTVVSHAHHAPLRREGERWRGTGSVDMKGGVALALALARWLGERRDSFAELGVLLVVDEEWRLQPFAHVERFAGYDACLCFEAGERSADGAEGVVVKRKAAGTLRVTGHGRAAHAGSNPDAGANALLALAEAALAAAALHRPDGPDALSVVPTMMRAGSAINVVPAGGELTIDVRAADSSAFARVLEASAHGAQAAGVEPVLLRSWPHMDTRAATASLLEDASARLGRRIVGVDRGGASDASHFAATLPLTIDGLGPRGGHAHSPEEYVYGPSLQERTEVALAVMEAVLAQVRALAGSSPHGRDQQAPADPP